MTEQQKQTAFICHPHDSGAPHEDPWGSPVFNEQGTELSPGDGLVAFYKEVFLHRPLRRATVTATALGVFELYLNGERVGTRPTDGSLCYDELKPGFTDYHSRVHVFSYDVTDYIKTGAVNRLLAEVSRGWWSGHISFGYFGWQAVGFSAVFRFTYEDGTVETVETDPSWTAMHGGAYRTADLWDGVYYDARRIEDYGDVCPAAIHPSAPLLCEKTDPPVRVLEAYQCTPVHATVFCGTTADGSDFGAIHVLREADGAGCERLQLAAGESVILDFGQNFVGRPKLSFETVAGCCVRCRFAEMRNDSGMRARCNDGPRGSLYLDNYRRALSRLVYVSAGGKTVFAPLHTFYGFRYMQLTPSCDLTLTGVSGEVIASALTECGSFSCSNREVNALYANILWGQRGNYLSIPTDCPQRDERLGWLCDTAVFAKTGAYNADVRTFLSKWLCDMRDSQRPDGAYPDVVPGVLQSLYGAAGWSDAAFTVPWTLYEMYGDKTPIADMYESLTRCMAFFESTGGPRDTYGDWLAYEPTDGAFVCLASHAHMASLMVRFSELLGFTERAEAYRTLAQKLTDQFRSAYVTEHGLTIETQTALLLSLSYALVPPSLRASLCASLRANIEKNGYRLTTGFLGTAALMPQLSKLGMDDLAYDLLLQTENPSWLYCVRAGATTMWERWNSYTTERGFGESGMNSFNHYAYGCVGEWLLGWMCGIAPREDKPGFTALVLQPTPDFRLSFPSGQTRLTHASGVYDSVRGRIESAWAIDGDTVTYRFTVPPQVEAEARLLGVTEKSRVLLDGSPVQPTHFSQSRACIPVPCGMHVLTVRPAGAEAENR